MMARFALWLARDDHAFKLLILVTVPPVLALTATGFF